MKYSHIFLTLKNKEEKNLLYRSGLPYVAGIKNVAN